MAYGGGSSGGGGSSSGGGGGSYGNSNDSELFVKVKDGVTAPAGFHFMPNGRLMSDADHIARYGYIDKTIRSFTIDTTDIDYSGETKSFTVNGDNGAIFSVEISDDGDTINKIPNYYNFTTGLFSATKPNLKKIQLQGGYSFSVNFPTIEFRDTTCDYNNDPTIAHNDDDGKIQVGMTVTGTGIPAGATVATRTSDTAFELSASTTGGAVTDGTLTFGGLIKKYTIEIHAHTAENIKTKHARESAAKFSNGTIDYNNSTGSNSNVLTKILHQDIKKYLYLSCIAPSLYATSADTINQGDGSTGTPSKIIIDGDATDRNVVQIGDKVTSGTDIPASVHALVTEINPDGDNTHEIKIGITDTISNNDAITFTPAFNGMTPNGTVSTTGYQTFEVSSRKNLKTNFEITCTAPTGRNLFVSRLPTINDLCAYTTVTFDASPGVLPGEDITGSTHFAWGVDNVAKLQDGMTLDPARTDGNGAVGRNTITPAIITKYLTRKTSLEVVDKKYHTEVKSTTIKDKRVEGVDSKTSLITAIDRTNIVTASVGNIIFNKQQPSALGGDPGVRIFGYGAGQIKSLTGVDVSITNIVITPTQVSTTPTAADDNSTTIPVTETGNISTANTIRGPGIDSSVANPTVSLKSTASGGGNLTASSAQTLEDGQTLYFDGASNILTIAGEITVTNMGLSDTTLYFDVEKFIKIS